MKTGFVLQKCFYKGEIIIISNDYYIYTGALRVFNGFNYKTDEYKFSYDYNASGYEKLISKYKIQEVAGDGSELEKALNLFQKHQLIFLIMRLEKAENTAFTADFKLLYSQNAALHSGSNRECYIVCRFHLMISTHMLYL